MYLQQHDRQNVDKDQSFCTLVCSGCTYVALFLLLRAASLFKCTSACDRQQQIVDKHMGELIRTPYMWLPRGMCNCVLMADVQPSHAQTVC